MEIPESKAAMGKTIGEISAVLLELRDALMELSLSLKDWQFEQDWEGRKMTEAAVQQLLTQIMSARDRSS